MKVGNSDADGNPWNIPFDLQVGGYDLFANPLGKDQRVLTAAVWEQDDEFIAAIAGQNIHGAQVHMNAVCHLLKHFVPCLMPGCVIYKLQVIHIEHNEGKRISITL